MLLFKRTHRVCHNQIYLSGTLSCVVTQAVIYVKGVYAKLQHDEGVTRVYVPRFFVSSQQRFGVTDIKALGASQLLGLGQTVLQLLDKSVLQLRVTALFYLDNSRKIHPRGVRTCRPKDAKRKEPETACTRARESPSPLALLFIGFFLPLGLPYVNWTSQECCLVCLRSSLRSKDLPLFYF